MQKFQAQKLVQDTFENKFSKEKFTYFIKNLLNSIDQSKAFHVRGYIPEIFLDHVKTYERIGTYTDPEDKKLDILIVYLKKETTLDKARTTQRNFIARYLKDRDRKEAGLIAFVSPDSKDWRFSYVKMDYKLTKTSKDKIKAVEEFTPSRRYSFLVGESESSHTAQSQLLPLVESEKDLSLSDIEDAFSVERVTIEFFKKYRDLFLKTKDALDDLLKKDKALSKDFKNKNIDTVNFAKKLLGQIVFLYFLQKKGWFGVSRYKDWGTGPKDFLRRLFEKSVIDYRNFYNDILEPLFYEALRHDRSYDDHYFSYFNCKIPFLNGGLFDPLNDYDWVKTELLLPDELFSNEEKTKEGDVGTGILDVFDRYNFTVNEDEPLEKEVAVDPEMLGKVFENLLEVKDRKSKGTYYTPREIVHYMCQESLINYLHTELNITSDGDRPARRSLSTGGKDSSEVGSISRDAIEQLIMYGESVIEHENRVETKGKETEKYSYKLPEKIRKNAKLIDEKLTSIRLCDPAVGSGAFPVGMMNEIVRTRNALTSYFKDKKGRTIYNFKRHAIQNCLYGVDIDPSAVEICKLRLWLSLVVDEEDIKQIKPLPNLDYKIVCGNSLLGVDKGNLFVDQQLKELEEVKQKYFNETNVSKKQKYKEKIDELISQITNGHKDFDFEVYFSEVFHEKKGFDVVLGNPPWEKVKPQDPELFRLYEPDYRKKSKNAQKKIKEKLLRNSQILKEYQQFLDVRYKIMKKASKLYQYQGSSDLNYYKLFIEKSLYISSLVICWLVPGSITIDQGSSKLRDYFLDRNILKELVGFSNKEGLFEWIDNNQKFIVLSLQKKGVKKISTYGWLSNAKNLDDLPKIKIDKNFYRELDPVNLTFYLDNTEKSFEILDRFFKDKKIRTLREIGFHYWREYDATLDQKYFNDIDGKHMLFSGKAIDQFDCLAKSWIENHGRSSKWKKMSFPKQERGFRTEYFVSEIPDRIVQHHNQDKSNFRIVIQNVTGTVNNVRTVYACALHKKHLTNNSLHNLYIGESDEELFYYLGIFNSFILDWQARIKVATNLNKFVLESFFFPTYQAADPKLRKRISTISFWLSSECSDFNKLKRKFNALKFENRESAVIELNALVAKLYNLNYEELQFILTYFSLVENNLKKKTLESYQKNK